MQKKEYGGYLPLELRHGVPYYDFGNTMMKKCNSGLTAIYCAIKALSPKRVVLPHFICDTVPELIRSMGVECSRYYISPSLEPLDPNVGEEDCILLVNYFGLCRDIVDRFADRFSKVIVDNTQAFFSAPIFRDGVYNVYSCRKFIGTSDGAYLIGKNVPEIPLESDSSSERSLFLLKQYESGTNAAYSESIENYNIIKRQRREMSPLTERLLCSVDYSEVMYRRLSNYDMLDSLLGKANKLSLCCSERNVPYSYPFYSPKDIRAALIREKIYVPKLWAEMLTDEYRGRPEYELSQNVMHLPIDQRYTTADMKYIANVVTALLEE